MSKVKTFFIFKIFWAKPTYLHVKIYVSVPYSLQLKVTRKDRKKVFTLHLSYIRSFLQNDTKS